MLLGTPGSAQQNDLPDYRNPNLPVELRLNDLLERMTLEEKVAQIQSLIGGGGGPGRSRRKSLFDSDGNLDTDKRGCRMNSRRVTKRKAESAMPDRSRFDSENPQDSSTDDKSVHEIEPQKIIAGFLDPNCEHLLLKLEDELQTLESEGKTIWKCRTCAEITNTYNWQTP